METTILYKDYVGVGLYRVSLRLEIAGPLLDHAECAFMSHTRNASLKGRISFWIVPQTANLEPWSSIVPLRAEI